MDMYIRMFDDLKKQDNDNPTIGIILCTEKDETVVKYSILNDSKQLFATKYMPYLPTEAELIAEIDREKRLIEMKFKGVDGCAWIIKSSIWLCQPIATVNTVHFNIQYNGSEIFLQRSRDGFVPFL